MPVVTSRSLECTTDELRARYDRAADRVRSVTLSGYSCTLASGSSDKTIKLWEAATGNLLQTLESHSYVWSVAFSSDSRTLASGSWDKTVKL
ncbi:hypothetical protein HK405_007108, partial [Cladochytrium tenue]